MKEAVRVGEESACLGKDLCVGRPTEAFITLWAVGRNRKIVRALSPNCVGDEFVDVGAACLDSTCLHFLRDRSHGNRLNRADCDIIRCCYRYETIAEEGASGDEGDKAVFGQTSAVAMSKRIVKLHT